MKTYSLDLRERVLADVDAGMKTSAVAAEYTVSTAWVRRLEQRRAATGQIGPIPQRRGPLARWVAHAEAIREAVRRSPDATLDEYRTKFRLPLSRAGLARALVSGPTAPTAR